MNWDRNLLFPDKDEWNVVRQAANDRPHVAPTGWDVHFFMAQSAFKITPDFSHVTHISSMYTCPTVLTRLMLYSHSAFGIDSHMCLHPGKYFSLGPAGEADANLPIHVKCNKLQTRVWIARKIYCAHPSLRHWTKCISYQRALWFFFLSLKPFPRSPRHRVVHTVNHAQK